MGRWYYLRGVRLMSGMAVIGAVIVAVAEPLYGVPLAGSVKYAYSVIVYDVPGVADALIVYVPFVVVRMEQAVLDVGGVGEVEMQTLNALAPEASCTVPVIVTGCFVGTAVGVGVALTGGSVRSGVGVGLVVGASVRTGLGVTVGVGLAEGVADGVGEGDVEGAVVGDADAVGAGDGREVSIFGALPPSWASATLAAARALAAASG
jgi:hypothetical protein